METTITIDYQPDDQAEADRIAGWIERLAKRFDVWEPDIDVRTAEGRVPGGVYLGSYAHKWQIDRLDALARILSRLLTGHDVQVTEEGDDDGYWGERSTYNSGRRTSTGHRDWVDREVHET